MKKILLLLISFSCLSACSAIVKKSDKKENQTTLKNDKKTESGSLYKGLDSGDEHHNLSKQKDNDEFDSDVAIANVKDFLNITDDKAFSFDIMKQSADSITVKVISKEMQKNGGSGAVGSYIVNKTGDVKEDVIPDILKGTWRSKDTAISYLIGDNTVQTDAYSYDITDAKITEDNSDFTTYELNWDLDNFKSEYPENSNPQPIIFQYQKVDDTIKIGVRLYRQ